MVNKSDETMSSGQSFFHYHTEIENELINDLCRTQVNGVNLNEVQSKEKLTQLLSWLRKTPKFTTIRINSLTSSTNSVLSYLKNSTKPNQTISTCRNLPELIILHSEIHQHELKPLETTNEVVVDAACGVAVLRGAHVFAPGVLGLTSAAKIGESINVYADTEGKCKKGLPRRYTDTGKMFVAVGILEQNREEIFRDGAKGSGKAVTITQTISGLPQVSDEYLHDGLGLLQNLPSIVCSRILDPQPGEMILDMCAAPGNKTTHLSALMNNQGLLIAMEKVKSKISKLELNCQRFGCTNVRVFCFDATKSVAVDDDDDNNDLLKELTIKPPFSKELFDRILLDGPCSVLGKRPQLFNKIRANELRSFVALQRKLFSAAVELLKPGGVLVYSTCTITVAENEGIVSWALKKFPCLRLSSAKNKYQLLGLNDFSVSPGYSIDGLTAEQTNDLLRFGPESETVGFFIALFTKTQVNELI